MLPEGPSRRLREGDDVIAVTGASGWLGMATLHVLAEALGEAGLRERVRAFASRARTLRLAGGTEVEARPLSELAEGPSEVTLLLHHAFLTKDRAGAGDAYLRANLELTVAVLAALARHPVRGLFLPSSGAVYGPGRALATDLEANPYGTLKHLDELAFRRASGDRDARCVVARVFNVAGPYMTKPELYALGDLVAAARAGRALVIRAAVPVRRDYVAITDVVALGLAALLDPAEAVDQIWDTASGRVVEMAGLAEAVRSALGVPELPIERAAYDPNASGSDYFGDPVAMRDLAERQGLALTPLEEQVRATAGVA